MHSFSHAELRGLKVVPPHAAWVTEARGGIEITIDININKSTFISMKSRNSVIIPPC